MSQKYSGGFITKSPVAPTTSAASGIWTLDQQQQAQKAGTWPSPPIFIEDLFSTYLYTGNGATQTITNGIDLSGQGGLVWTKLRSGPVSPLGHGLEDTTRGATKRLASNTTAAESTFANSVTSFSSTGYVIGSDDLVNSNYGGGPNTYVSWTFREQPKFFDIVTYTGNATAGRTIAHNLGSVPGCIIVKQTGGGGSGGVNNWFVYHRSLGATQAITLESTGAAFTSSSPWNNTTPTSTVFTVGGTSDCNDSGGTYVAYLFAHDAGGFPVSGGGSTNGISCGSFTADGSGNFTVNLGYEPQWLMFKRTNSTSDWVIVDNMRGWTAGGDEQRLYANTSGVEAATANYESLTATGFASLGSSYVAGATFIYIAIRRGPMKTPTVGTSVLNITTSVGTNPAYVSSFPVDFAYRRQITGTSDNYFETRLQGPVTLYPNYATNEGSDANVTWDYQNGMFTSTGANANQYGWLMRRAPSFMDVVCYTGTGVAGLAVTHNLSAVPELMIVKGRNNSQSWGVYTANTGNTAALYLNATDAVYTGDINYWNNTSPTSTQFTVGVYQIMNGNGVKYIAYLFSTCPGVSKVGSYTGNGTTQTINCGFTGGARFVIIKRTDSTGGWYVYDTVRGMTVLTDPYVFLNSNAVQVATLGSVTTVSTGFALNSAVLADINVNAGNYIFLAIA